MDAERIVKLSSDAIEDVLRSRAVASIGKFESDKRRRDRWPFAGTVEVWLPDDCYGERHLLATLHNLSPGGLAMRTRRPIDSDTKISLALHQPDLSCYGHAMVRHCTRAPIGYLIGVEFIFEEQPA